MLTITSFKVTLETGGGTVVLLTAQILHKHQLLLSPRAAEDASKPNQQQLVAVTRISETGPEPKLLKV